MNLPELQRLMQEFQMQDSQLEDKTEMMGDAIEDAVAGENDEEEEEEIVSRVLDEIGIDMAGLVPEAHKGDLAAKEGAAATSTQNPVAVGAGGGDLDDLEARLNNLKK